jgi:hypothetical protein
LAAHAPNREGEQSQQSHVLRPTFFPAESLSGFVHPFTRVV